MNDETAPALGHQSFIFLSLDCEVQLVLATCRPPTNPHLDLLLCFLFPCIISNMNHLSFEYLLLTEARDTRPDISRDKICPCYVLDLDAEWIKRDCCCFNNSISRCRLLQRRASPQFFSTTQPNGWETIGGILMTDYQQYTTWCETECCDDMNN